MATLIGRGAHGQDIMAGWVKHDCLARRDRWIAHHSEWDGDGLVVLGINDPQLRAKVAIELGVEDLPWVSPLTYANLHHHVQWEHGTHINYAVQAVRTTMGHHVTVSPGVTICGDVRIGNRTLIGAGAVICDRVTIGNDVTIGAGTIVLPESGIGDGETWVGNPARRIK